jgi:non-haem Fe2+, alpha-ketoglutarate-dependent halogenase
MKTEELQLKSDFSFNSDDLARFHRDGFAGPFVLYTPEEITKLWRRHRVLLLNRSAAVYQEKDALSGGTNIANYDRHLDNPFLADHVCRREIVDKVTSILGRDALCWRTEFFPKYPGDEGTDWHQADTFANASGSPQIVWPDASTFGGTITVWCAFTAATEETACLQVMPGTHSTMFYDETKRMHYNPSQNLQVNKSGVSRGFFGYDYRELQVNPDWKPDEAQAVSLVMRPGEFVIFWSTLMHASFPHLGKTQEMRMGYAARYVPTSVHVYPGSDYIEEYGGRISLERYGAVLVSGTNRYTHNKLVSCTTRGHLFRSSP